MKSSIRASLVAVACVVTGACHPAAREQPDFSASDEWTRSYQLTSGGEVVVVNKSGPIQVEAGDGTAVEVRATRRVKAKSEKTANEIVPRIRIAEDTNPKRILIRTEGIEGILMGVSFEVAYHVRVPAEAKVRVQTANGDVALSGIAGQVVAVTANGTVKGTDLSGGVEARSTNGKVTIDLSAIGVDPIALRTVNGSVELSIPESAKANLSASSRNGSISTGSVPFEATTEPERGRSPRLKGRINGGGTAIDLQTVNGNVTLTARVAPKTQD